MNSFPNFDRWAEKPSRTYYSFAENNVEKTRMQRWDSKTTLSYDCLLNITASTLETENKQNKIEEKNGNICLIQRYYKQLNLSKRAFNFFQLVRTFQPDQVQVCSVGNAWVDELCFTQVNFSG